MFKLIGRMFKRQAIALELLYWLGRWAASVSGSGVHIGDPDVGPNLDRVLSNLDEEIHP